MSIEIRNGIAVLSGLDISGLTATTDDVKSGSVFVGASGKKETGTATILPEGLDAVGGDVRSGKTFVGALGQKQTGTLTVPDVSGMTANAGDVLEGKIFIGSSGGKTTGAMRNIDEVTVTPSISVDSNGEVSATVSGSAGGYVNSVTGSATKQLPTYSGGTVQPGSSTKLVATAGTYLTGNLYVGGGGNYKTVSFNDHLEGVSVAGGESSIEKYMGSGFNGTLFPWSLTTDVSSARGGEVNLIAMIGCGTTTYVYAIRERDGLMYSNTISTSSVTSGEFIVWTYGTLENLRVYDSRGNYKTIDESYITGITYRFTYVTNSDAVAAVTGQ